jgi:Stigma-specific protein, Stig1
MRRDTVGSWGFWLALCAIGCLPKVDFTPCAERGTCPHSDVPDASVDRPTGCSDAMLCDAEALDAPTVDVGACSPACRSGFLCVSGACVSACNPPCAPDERCVAQEGTATCVSIPTPDAGDIVFASDAQSDSTLDAAENSTGDVPDASEVALADALDDRGGLDVTEVADVLDAPDVDDVPSDVCASPRSVCEGACVDTRSDRSHCGACGRRCYPQQVCLEGMCQCTGGTSLCDLNCVDLRTDNENCGHCNGLCTLTGQVCVSSRCVCPAGLTACGRGAFTCADLQTSSSNCGACGNTCPSTQVCRAGRCVTP